VKFVTVPIYHAKVSKSARDWEGSSNDLVNITPPVFHDMTEKKKT
jgi:hypothetical protein